MPEMLHPARQEEGTAGFAETGGCGVPVLCAFPFCPGLFLCFCPRKATFASVTIRMT